MSNVRPFLSKEQQALVVSERKLPGERAASIARRTRTPEIRDEMESAGDEGLAWAGHRYSGTEGVPFRPFAQLLVDRAIFRFLKQEMRHRKLSAAGYVIASHGAAQIAPRSGDLLDALYDGEDVALEKMRKYVDAKVIAGVMALVTDPEERADPERVAMTRELMALVRKQLAEQSAADRDLFTALYAEGRTAEDLAVSLGMSPVTVRARHRRLLLNLRAALVAHDSTGIAGA